ncbi:hypothetical protein DM860_017663 [Cuscuta australis]|uniref:Uncharacterized protein n=1 Tax=Cuscuta australis TaxID=267555 RepID=A0A328DXF3_9ASTE|nr:hypothetical protein DM860_017663 [Cuscuta australis]
MFRSRRAFEEYQHLLENEGGAPNDFTINDIDDTFIEEDTDNDHDYRDDDDSNVVFDLDPSLIPVPEGFNDDEEVLTIDAQGNVSKLRGRITVNVVIGLDAGTRILVPMNKLLHPVKKAGGLFNRFLADIAKRPRFCPINYGDWRVVPTVYKKRILEYIKKKFVLPSTDSVQDKILSTIGERLRGYKRFLQKKYIQKGTTKEDLYNLPIVESSANEGLVRPREVDDAMWAGFVTLSFSPEFEKKSQHGKTARGKLTHSHTNGSESFAISFDKFERKHKRKLGPIERFIQTREKKDKTFHEPITTEFVNSAIAIIQKKTRSCNFSEETREAEKFAYTKLMGPQPEKGKVTGLGCGVNARDLRKIRCEAEPIAMAKILKKLQTMEDENKKMKDQIASLTSKFGDHSSSHTDPINGGDSHEDSRRDSPFKECMTPEVPRHDGSITRSEFCEASRDKTRNRLDLSHDSPCTRGLFYGCQSERETDSLEKTNHQEQGGFQKQVATIALRNVHLLKSSTTTKVASHNDKGEPHKVSQAAPTTSASSAAILQPQKCTSVRHSATHPGSNKNHIHRINKVGDIGSNTTPTIFDACKEQKTSEKEKIPLPKNMNRVQLSQAQLELLVDKLATGLCKYKAEPNLLNTVLREKLEKSILMLNKDNNTRKDGKPFL